MKNVSTNRGINKLLQSGCHQLALLSGWWLFVAESGEDWDSEGLIAAIILITLKIANKSTRLLVTACFVILYETPLHDILQKRIMLLGASQ